MLKYIKYEIKNALGNIFSIIFGIIFPIFMTILFSFVLKEQIDLAPEGVVATKLFITNALMSPLALVLIGFSALFSQEIEKDITTRMSLFGYDEKKQLVAKFVAQITVMIISLIIYSLTVLPIIHIQTPSIFGITIFVLAIFLLALGFFVLAYGISILAKRFSVTYGITMSLYFATMVLSGMMGIQYQQLPTILQGVSNMLPTTHITQDIPQLWKANSYNLAPLLQSLIFLICFASIIYFIAIQSKKRRIG